MCEGVIRWLLAFLNDLNPLQNAIPPNVSECSDSLPVALSLQWMEILSNYKKFHDIMEHDLQLIRLHKKVATQHMQQPNINIPWKGSSVDTWVLFVHPEDCDRG